MIFLVSSMCMYSSAVVPWEDSEWTRFFQKEFTFEQSKKNDSRPFIEMVCGNTVVPFNQLIFTWNAFRPEKGYFVFQAQIKTKRWSEWHTMSEWGAGVQRSFLSKLPDGSIHHHVRLHTASGEYASGLRIRIVPKDGAFLSCIKSVGVSVANLSKAPSSKQFAEKASNYNSIKINGVPSYSQMVVSHPKADVICSPTSCSMLVAYLLKEPIDPGAFAEKAYDFGLGAYGSWPFNTAHAFELCQGRYSFHVQRLNSFDWLYASLKKGIPVIVSVRGNIEGSPKEYPNGHLLLIVGWNKSKRTILCHDPAQPSNEQVPTAYDLNSFCDAWSRSHYLAYSASQIK